LIVKEAGIYQVTIEEIGTSCVITDKITFRDLKYSKDLRNCNTGAATYILTQNSAKNLGLDESIYELFYFTDPTDAKIQNATVNPQRFSSAGEQTIYIKIKNKTTNAFLQFDSTFSVTT
jgi:hypothetical protein